MRISGLKMSACSPGIRPWWPGATRASEPKIPAGLLGILLHRHDGKSFHELPHSRELRLDYDFSVFIYKTPFAGIRAAYKDCRQSFRKTIGVVIDGLYYNFPFGIYKSPLAALVISEFNGGKAFAESARIGKCGLYYYLPAGIYISPIGGKLIMAKLDNSVTFAETAAKGVFRFYCNVPSRSINR